MIMAQEKHFIKAQEEFDALLGWIDQTDEEGLRIDQVERGLFSRLLAIGFVLLEVFVSVILAQRGSSSYIQMGNPG